MKIYLIVFLIMSSLYSSAKVELPLIGTGTYSFMFLDVYQAKLWGANKKNLYSNHLKLELEYRMNFQGIDIVKQTKKEFENAGVTSSKSDDWGEILKPIFPDIRKGDRLLADYRPEDGIKFYLNDKNFLGEVKDIEMSKAFLDIWLGPKTSDVNLRDNLIGVRNE